ncbi:iron complex transport system substrate-binding protein [Prauserella shujinwangii]|uniref:Iron complex transport system substrate-binding protein n=1 Tax=Prauserella shujinwangii TaxID=1453103 RepID=A0A2T0LZK3_9PSEU|nr:ABC transporter substrate-binding protein [Prauserella shujinwangii]PRX49530.1 iron complex transport system substrate-binding protein [Prauserella shujinwangii]
MPRLSRLLPLLPLLCAAVLAGCAERPPSAETPAGSAGFPVELRPEGAPAVTIEKRPERIVSLSPSATEVLYAVGAGPQVVAVDSASTYPEQAPRTDLSGLNLDPEAIAAHDPDLVVVESDLDGRLTGALAKTGTTTLVLPAATSLRAAYDQFELLGRATGYPDEGADLARRTRTEIQKIVRETPEPAEPLTYYHELDPTYYSVTSKTFIGQVYGLFGLVNIADQGDPDAASDYPQLSAERILEADPDLIFLADTHCCGQNAETVAARPGWDTLTAVEHGRVYPLDDDIASRWTPRLVDFVHAVSTAVTEASR